MDDRDQELIERALAVCDRWDSPDWSDARHTRDFIRDLREAADALADRLSEREGWREIESAPKDRPFWARKSNNEIALCWRHNPSSRTDVVVTWTGNRAFKAVEWRYPDALPSPPGKLGR